MQGDRQVRSVDAKIGKHRRRVMGRRGDQGSPTATYTQGKVSNPVGSAAITQGGGRSRLYAAVGGKRSPP